MVVFIFVCQYSERLGNARTDLIREIENGFWRVLFRIASREIGLVGGIKELVGQLPMDVIGRQSLVERRWFNLRNISRSTYALPSLKVQQCLMATYHRRRVRK